MSWGVATRNAVGLGLAGIVSLVSRAVQQAVAVVDPFFNYVTLLLPGNGTNGAQNNTFVDSSTNAFTITRNGNTTQGTFSPFSQTGWGAYFDGSGDYLDIANVTTDFGSSNDFTIEFWMYPTVIDSSIKAIIDPRSSDSSAHPLIWINASNQIYYFTTGSNRIVGTTTLTANRWYHVALVRNSGTTTLYLDGASEGSWADTVNYVSSTVFRIAQRYTGTAYNYAGYLTNLRIVKGTAVYTAAFTPPTAPLTAVSGTQLLTCQSNRFIDNSSNAFAITVNGDTSIQAFSPFNPTAAWSAATNGGSGYFDGSGDYLRVADNAAFTLGSGDFTIEAWVYPTLVNSAQHHIAGQADSSGTAGSRSFRLSIETSNKFVGRVTSGSTSYDALSTSTAVANTWQHVAFVRDGNTTRLYINGVQEATDDVTAVTVNDSSNELGIGAQGELTSALFAGYISDFRMVVGTCVYPNGTTFTPPTAPLTAITNTELLCNFTNAGIFDATAKNDLETVGNAQISTTQSKFGGSSMYFDGTGDRLITRDSPITRIGTAPFTIEAWIYPTNVSPASNFTIIAKGTSSAAGTWQFDITSASKLRFQYDAAGAITSSASLTANVWTHVVVVREGTGSNQTKLYINGSNDGTGTISSNLNTTAIVKIGQNRDSTTDYPGYIQDLRLTNGIARYTTAFTPPTAAFPLT